MKTLLLFIAITAILFSGCHKLGSDAPQTGIVLRNKNNDLPLHIDIYRTYADYNSGAGFFFSGVIPANGCLPVGDSILARGTKYYCDVYTDDHRYSNWTDTFRCRFTTSPSAMPDTILVACDYTPQKYVFLGATNVETHWHAVDRYTWSISDWWLLSETDKYREVIIRRDMTGQIKSKDALNNIIIGNIYSIAPFVTPGSAVEGLFLVGESGNGYKMLNCPVSPLNNPDHRVSADTVIFEDHFGYWVMVKQ